MNDSIFKSSEILRRARAEGLTGTADLLERYIHKMYDADAEATLKSLDEKRADNGDCHKS